MCSTGINVSMLFYFKQNNTCFKENYKIKTLRNLIDQPLFSGSRIHPGA